MPSKFKYIVFLLISFTFSPTVKAEFVPLPRDEILSCDISLVRAKDISHKCQAIINRDNELEVWQTQLAFDFGKISQAEFNYLKNTYGGWSKSKSLVSYNQNQSYQLIDFLPPTIQVFNSHRFIPESTELKHSSEDTKHLYMNCWGLVYEVLRGAINPLAKPGVFMGQGSIMLKLLRANSDRLFSKSELEQSSLSAIDNKPGDIILVMHTSSSGHEYLDHIAIAIDDGIYFEKAGTGENVPIRIIDRQTLTQIWQPGVFDYEVLRLKQDAVLPHPQQLFSLNANKIQQEFPSLNDLPSSMRHGTSIMWEESGNDLATSSLFEMVNNLPIFITQTGRSKLMPQLYQPLFD